MEVSVNLAVDQDHDFAATIDSARDAGLTVTQAFDDLGIASGTIDRDKLPALMRVQGIIVEEDRPLRALDSDGASPFRG